MIFVLLAFSQCVTFGNKVKILTKKNWQAEIEDRSNLTVYLVMFHGQHCPACQMAYPNFIEAANSATSNIKFGEVDTSRENELAYKFQIRGIPTFITFHPNGHTNYMGDRSTRSFINTAYKYVPNVALEVDETWQNGNRSVILFSDKKSVPPLWKAVASHFFNTSVKVGFTANDEIKKLFKITAFPTILMIDNGTQYVYPGKNSFPEIRKSVVDFFHGKITQPTPKPSIVIQINQLENEDKFKEFCKGHGKYCVIKGNTEEASASLKMVAKKYRNDPFHFLLCGEKCPLDFLKKSDAFWIIHPRRDAAIVAESEEALKSDLDRVIGGDAMFTPMSKLTQPKDL